ncbi:VOC family protein [Effusibacillus consociatus]|uniref:VOC family protein n=1 Tax=Effusibacillus consociatus TaxID=1117041 RepID=A0ABV9QAH8_9BACL
MIECHSIHHISIVVTDLERAKSFYRDVLGLREIPRPNFDFPGAWFEIGNQQLHVIVHPPSQTLRTEGGIDSRDGHFAIRVTSYEQTLRHLEKLNVPHKAKPDSITGWAQIFCCDPDGNIIELNAERETGTIKNG